MDAQPQPERQPEEDAQASASARSQTGPSDAAYTALPDFAAPKTRRWPLALACALAVGVGGVALRHRSAPPSSSLTSTPPVSQQAAPEPAAAPPASVFPGEQAEQADSTRLVRPGLAVGADSGEERPPLAAPAAAPVYQTQHAEAPLRTRPAARPGQCRVARGRPGKDACGYYVKVNDAGDGSWRGFPHGTGCADEFYMAKYGCSGSEESVAACLLSLCNSGR